MTQLRTGKEPDMRPWKIASGLLLAGLISMPLGWGAEEEEEEEPKLLGRSTVQQLEAEPYADWFMEGYDEYEPNSRVTTKLKEMDKEGVAIEVFFGSWCGDSQREVPRLVKLLDEIEFPDDRLTLVAVDHVDTAYKQSPDGEESGLEVYRVPTIVVSRDGREVARVVEYPVLSLERDLLSILEGEPYQPDFASYPMVRNWLLKGLLSDENVSPLGLAGQVRHQVNSEGELAAAGRVFLDRGETVEAVKLFQVNCVLFPESSSCFARLAHGLLRSGDKEEARQTAEKALRLNTEPERVKSLVELIEKTQD